MLRKILSLTLTIALLATFCTFPVSAASPSIGVHTVNAFSGTVKATNFVADTNVKTIGRNNPGAPLLFAWHASGVEFDVTGTSVVGVRLKDYATYNSTAVPLVVTINGEHVTLDGSDNTEIYDYNESNQTWLANNPQPDKNCFEVPDDGAQHDYIFATDLDPSKTYTVKVTMDIENWAQYQYYAFWAVSALTDNTSSAKVSKTADAENKILFLGDSITSARNIGGIHNAYHQLTAQAFGADTQVISAGGAVFYNGYLHNDSTAGWTTDKTTATMKIKMSVSEFYNKTSWYARSNGTFYVPELADNNGDGVFDTYSTKADPNFTPDLVFFNIGTNDRPFLENTTAIPDAYSSSGYATVGEYNRNLFKTQFTAWANEVRELYNNPTIILAYGMMTRSQTVMNLFDQVVADYKTANPTAKVSTYFFDSFEVNAAGKLQDSHPDKNAHKTAAKLLISEVEEVMGWTAKEDESGSDSGEGSDTTYTPKTVTVIRNPYLAAGSVEVKPSTPSTNAHKSFIPFVLSHKDIYVGDTIKFADDLFTANTFTFEGTKIVYAKMWVQKYSATEVKNGIDSQTGATYTFTEPGIYILRNEHFRLDNGSGGTKYQYFGDGRFDVFEVKDPNAVEAVAKPTTNKTSGATAASVTQAVIDTMSTSYTSDAVISLDFTSSEKHITEHGNPAATNPTGTVAGLVLDYKFTLNSVSYVDSVSWKANADNGIYMVDVYGSIDGEDWYLINEDCVVSPNGLNTTTSETTFTADVDGVAKYVKLANPRWKGQCLSKYTKTPSVVGFELADGEWSTGNEGGETPDPEEPDTPSGDPTATTYFYPEYPEYTDDGELILPRDYDYEVYVNDGAKDTQIPVYNATRNINSYVSMVTDANGNKTTDSHRRFSEFSFDGEVTVKIKVKGKMTSYAVLPSNDFAASDSSYDASTGIISVKLTEPKNFIVRLNENADTIISIFAEDLWTQAEVPTGSNVITYKPGYHDPAKNSGGQIEVSANQTVYLYPGAIVNARVKIKSWDQGSNSKIMGRGSFIDPRTSGENTPKNTSDGQVANMVTGAESSNVTIKGVKLLDAHCFNIVFSGVKNFLVDDVKILSSEISTDGVTTYGSASYGTVQNNFIYCNDNGFVMSGGSTSNGGIQFKNNIVGSGYAIIYPQGPIPNMTIDGLDIFRFNDFYRSTVDSEKTDTRTISIKNVRAEDATYPVSTKYRNIILLKAQDSATQTVTFENVSLPKNVTLIESDGSATGLTFTFKSVYVGGTKLTSMSNLSATSTGSASITFASGGSYNGGKFASALKSASHTADPVIIIGKGLTTPYYKVSFEKREDGTVYVPVAYILKKAGYTVKVENNGAKVTASDDNTTVVLTETSASNTTLTNKPELVNGVLMAPTSLMEEVYGLKAGLNADGNLLVSANGYDNLLKDGGFENLVETSNFNNTLKFGTSYDWSHFYHGKYYYDTANVRSGNYSMKVTTTKTYRGISQSIADVVKTYGAGSYTFEAYIKLDAASTDSTMYVRYGLGQASWNYNESGNKLKTPATGYSSLSSTNWTKLSYTFEITESDVARADVLSILVVASNQTYDPCCFYLDDASLKFTPTEETTKTPDIVPYIATDDRTIYYEYDGTNAVINTAKTPSGITVKVGDRIDIRDVLMQKYPNIDLNRVTLKTAYTSGTWYQAPAVDEIYAAETGTLTISISKYFDVSGTKKTVSDTLLTVTVSSSTAPSNLSTYSYSLLNDSNSIIHGRVSDSALNQFYWQGSGAEFKFTGTTVGLKVTTKSTQKIIYQIDGGKEQTLVVAGVNASNVGYTYILAEGLENTTHTVKFLRSYESFWGAATISAVTPSGKWPSKPTSTSELKIQFIGDSITSGNSLENYTYDYAYLTAKQLNADFQAFSISGAVMSDFKLDDSTRKSAHKTPVIPYIYGDSVNYSQTKKGYYVFDEATYTGTFTSGENAENVFKPSDTKYTMSRFTPDIVVINLGTNDASGITNSNSAYNKEVFSNMYANFLMKLSEYYPDAKFVLSYGMMGCNQTVYNCIEDALTIYRSKGGTNGAKVLKYTNSTDKAYDNAHPGVVGHATAANELVAAINEGFEEVTGIVIKADAQGNVTLPPVVLPEGKLLKGWYDENGEAFVVGTKVEANSTVTLNPQYIDVGDALTDTVNADGVANTTTGDSLIDASAKFINGMYYQGIQVRKDAPTGLRFIFARGLELEQLITTALGNSNFQVRYLVDLKDRLNGQELTIETVGKVNNEVENIYRTSEQLTVDGKEAEGYEKFTVCITGLDAVTYLNTVISVRPYITYTDASGQEHILYGGQANCSLYQAAKAVYDGSTNESDKEWISENILSLIIGDNDANAGDIFK